MAEVTIFREAVEAAARVLADSDPSTDKKWDDLQPSAQYRWAVRAKAALAAAAPLIAAAELERAAKDFELEVDELTDGMDVAKGPVVETYLAEVKQFRRRAAELRAQS